MLEILKFKFKSKSPNPMSSSLSSSGSSFFSSLAAASAAGAAAPPAAGAAPPPPPAGMEANLVCPSAISSSTSLPASSLTTKSILSDSASMPTDPKMLLMLAASMDFPPSPAKSAAATYLMMDVRRYNEKHGNYF